MVIPIFANVKKRASLGSFLYRQIFITPTVPHNVNLKGKTAIVTGSNTGIGLDCARQLLDLGTSKLIIAVRNSSKAERARENLLHGRPALQDISVEHFFSFVNHIRSLERLDIVVLNAGVSKQFFELAPSTNHEETIQVSVLLTALLAILLLPILKAQNSAEQPARLAIVSSDTASWAKFKENSSTPLLPALDKPATFTNTDPYATSKLLGQLFVAELARRVPPSVAIITMPNPGWVYGTGLGHVPGGMWGDLIISVPRCLLVTDAVIVLWREILTELSFVKVEDVS
ncbi:retinol dehydrogenase 12 [Xylariaceae sp. AK1471]|nr:retinol dehydrogenase 12 [Xylariaceae sp. AK1471]